jgi:hypothetical protein
VALLNKVWAEREQAKAAGRRHGSGASRGIPGGRRTEIPERLAVGAVLIDVRRRFAARVVPVGALTG